ncbi:hypothetical protein AVEN_162498-1 [Araneus ventricosus]|uniref:Uncharacterized protein n=1 Tax=Araneus ventricosus TaxID=182803 RepID=A0A4Y2QP02_ARAVE|nr:hypothetical protein AVEN_236082-1 [Araneus ventricosus]GBN65061.1 hypothetical protein AVEN_162498-1 [Araneus ventricosus]
MIDGVLQAVPTGCGHPHFERDEPFLEVGSEKGRCLEQSVNSLVIGVTKKIEFNSLVKFSKAVEYKAEESFPSLDSLFLFYFIQATFGDQLVCLEY